MRSEKDKKILFIGDICSIHFFRWIDFFAELGVDCSVVSGKKRGIDSLPNEKYREIDISAGERPSIFNKISRIFSYWKVFQSETYDAVNFHYLHWNIAILSLFIKRPIVITCLGSDVLMNYKDSVGIKRWLYDLALRRADVITFDAPTMKEVLAQGKSPSFSRKLRLVYFGVDTDWFRPGSSSEISAARNSLGLPNDSVVFTSIRTVVKRYKIHLILDWFMENFSPDDLGSFLLIRVSSASDKAYVKECQAKAQKYKNIVFDESEKLPHEMREIYWASNVFMHYPWSDATPVSMLEAFASMAGIICSDELPAYEELSLVYTIERIALRNLKKSVLPRILKNLETALDRNREAVVVNASRKKTIQDIHDILNDL